MIHLAYFTGTGNTKYLATKLKDQLGLDNEQFSRIGQIESPVCEHLIIMFPIHGFNPPRPVKKAFDRLIKHANTVSFIAVGCNDLWVNDAVSLSFINRLEGRKLGLNEIIAMPLAFVMEFPHELAENLVTEATMKIHALKECIDNEIYVHNEVTFKSKVINKLGRIESSAARLFGLELHATKSCNKCGVCFKACSFDNICEVKGKPKFGLKCGLCMNCIYTCPEQAIEPYISRFIPIKTGYSLNKYLKE
jgi:ferredoxin